MIRLDELLAVADKHGRQKAIADYARTLNVNVNKARKANGEFAEEELAILIFDAEKNRQKNK